MPPNMELIGFSDDKLVVISGNSAYGVGRLPNDALLKVVRKIREISLHIAAHKTEAILSSSRKKYALPKLKVNGLPIAIGKYLKYL